MTSTAAAFEAAIEATAVAAQPTIAAARRQIEAPVRCGDIPVDQFLLTSPVGLPAEMGEIVGGATIFAVPPNTIVRAPIGGKLTLGGGQISAVPGLVDWLTITQGNNAVSIALWRGDYERLFDAQSTYVGMSVKRGEPLARITAAASRQARLGATVGIGKFNVYIFAYDTSTSSRLPLGLASELWFGGAAATCQDWPPEPTPTTKLDATPHPTPTPTPASTDFPTIPPYSGSIPTPSGRIAYLGVTDTTSQSADAFIFDSGTAEVLQITHGEWQLSTSSPIGWLPDGQSLYLMASSLGREDQKLVVVNVDSGESRIVPSFPSSDVNSVVASPDGTRFLWTRNNNAYVASATDAEPQQLLDGQMPVFYPTWSPDGRQIAFVTQRADTDSQELYLVPVDGGTPEAATALQTERTNEAPFVLSDLSWSPDGSRLAFVSRVGKDPDQRYEVCVLTLSANSIRCFDNVNGFRLTWLSDNRGMLFTSRVGGIYKLDTTSGEVFTLTHDPSDAIVQSDRTSPDSQFLLFRSNRDYWRGEIYILHINSGQIVARVTSGFDGYYSAAWSPK